MHCFSIVDLETAINAAREACPSTGFEHALAEDVDALASIYGELIFRGHSEFDADSIDDRRWAVFERWVVVESMAMGSAA